MAKKKKDQSNKADVADVGTCYLPDDGDWRVAGGDYAHQAMLFDTAEAESELNRGEKDENDDPEFGNDLSKAGMRASTLTPAAMADSGPKAWSVERALPLFAATTGEMKNRGAITSEEKQCWDDLAKTLLTHYDVFSFQVAMLWRVLEIVHVKAKRNYDRLLNIPTRGFMDKNAGWISCVLRVASEHLQLPHSTAFPGETGFEPQNTTENGRTTLRRLISQLMEVSLIATCNGCGEWVAFDKKGEPFTKCKKCRDADRVASELRQLTEKLEEKKLLLLPLEELLTELSAAGSYWVDDMVKKGREKAHVAFDNAFKHQIDWLTKQVADLWVTIKTNGITEADREKVEKTTGYLCAEIEKVRTFQHLTWCGCGAPTYDWMHPKKMILMKAGAKCEECRRANKQNKYIVADQGGSLSDEDVIAAQDAGVSVTAADGAVLVEAEVVEPVFDPSDKYARAWDRRKKGQAIEKGKSKRKQ